MTTKLTLTLDDAVISNAKKYARKRGKSLSGIVENYLLSLTRMEEQDEPVSPQILKLKGVIKLPDGFNYKKELRKSLSKKYSK